MTPEQLQAIQKKAEATLNELVDVINHTPHLAAEIGPLMMSPEILSDFHTMMTDRPELAEQLFRLTLATTLNYHTSVETAKQLTQAES